MTTKTKKILVALLLCFVLLVTVCLGVFCFIPNFDVNDYGDYFQSFSTVLQKSMSFTNSAKAKYSVKLDEDVENVDVIINAIQTRLAKAYGYYGSKVDYDKQSGLLSIQIPVSNNTNTKAQHSEYTVLKNITVNGKVEILNATYPGTYSEDSVVLTQEHFRRASIQSYVREDATMYVCKVKLTREGKQLAKSLETGTAYTCALDGEAETWFYYTGNEIDIYYAFTDETQSAASARAMLGFISSGSLGGTLTQEGDGIEIVENNLGWVFLLVFGLIVLASFVFFAVRYKMLGIIPILMQALVVFVFIFFGAIVYLEIFNVAMAVGVILAYLFMSFFTAFTFEKMRTRMQEKSYSWARYTSFQDSMMISGIAHAALLVLGIILWVIPTVVTAPLGNAFVYGAILSFIVTFGLNRLFALMVSPFYEDNSQKTKARK